MDVAEPLLMFAIVKKAITMLFLIKWSLLHAHCYKKMLIKIKMMFHTIRNDQILFNEKLLRDFVISRLLEKSFT